MLDPYSVRICSDAVAANANGPSHAVPSGYQWVITDVGAWQAIASGNYVVIADDAAGTILIGVMNTISVGYGHWTGRLVMPAGSSFHIRAYGAAANVTVCGYQLTVQGTS